ncbi:unnamed protein product [Mesocestoides corti]|uniref:Uncharacterized protein n=1 Tax=Mesocestoides corti TaxID=53468 RepID=A0A0R3UFB2_MESCO|nr:unnamed protein product [Mesocestoides corti]
MDWMSDKAEKMPIASERLTEGRTPGQTQAPADPALGLPTVTSVRNVAELMYGLTPKNLLGLTAPNGKPLHEDESVGHLCTTLTERERIIRALIKKQLRDKKYKRGPEITAVLCDLAKGEKYISGAAAEAVYDAFEPPLDDELRELLFDVVRGENLNKESGGEENESKTINWKLLASILDPNRIQPWEKSPQHNCIDEYPCLPQIAERLPYQQNNNNGPLIKRLFEHSDIKKDIEEECEFEEVWDLAKECDRKRMAKLPELPHSDLVTLDSFWRALHHLNRKTIAEKVAAKYNPCCTSKLFAVGGEMSKSLITQQ